MYILKSCSDKSETQSLMFYQLDLSRLSFPKLAWQESVKFDECPKYCKVLIFAECGVGSRTQNPAGCKYLTAAVKV